MNTLLDQLLVLAALTAAVGYFIWHGLSHKRKGGSGCGGGCDCGAKKTQFPPATKD